MLEIILMLFGLAFPSTNANTQNVHQDQTEVSQTANSSPDDTGGETYIPPRR